MFDQNNMYIPRQLTISILVLSLMIIVGTKTLLKANLKYQLCGKFNLMELKFSVNNCSCHSHLEKHHIG